MAVTKGYFGKTVPGTNAENACYTPQLSVENAHLASRAFSSEHLGSCFKKIGCHIENFSSISQDQMDACMRHELQS